MARLSELLGKIDRHRLPVHVTPAARLMFKTMASALGGLNGLILGQLLNPILTNRVLNLLGDRGRLFDPLLHNSVSATILHGSEKINVIPSAVFVELDGRLLPGYQPDDLIGAVFSKASSWGSPGLARKFPLRTPAARSRCANKAGWMP